MSRVIRRKTGKNESLFQTRMVLCKVMHRMEEIGTQDIRMLHLNILKLYNKIGHLYVHSD